MNILIVDDDQVDREHIKRTLSHHNGYSSITEAMTVEEGLTQFRQNHFDVILLDYSMPCRDGLEMLIELRSEPKENCTAIVMMSTSDEEQLALRCLRAGAQDFMIKGDITAPLLRRAILNAQTRFELEKKLDHSYHKVKQLAEKDSLTGLANRHMFDQALKFAIANHTRTDSRLALLLIDLDNFKYVNDTHGHDAGDILLKKVVERIQKNLRGNEFFARLGGDEFGIILTNIQDTQDITHIAQRILSVLNTPFQVGQVKIKSAISIGIALHPDNGKNAEEMFKFSDIAMYRAKKRGRNQICFFQEEMQAQFTERYEIEEKLRSAIKEQQFILYYQPVINVKTKGLIGFEALIRCTAHEDIHLPDAFIPVAEESRLILPIGRWVITTAIHQLSIWNAKSGTPLTMAINLSVVQLTDITLPQFIEEELLKYGIDPNLIEFELTETALLDNSEDKINVINQIHKIGCRIALDDFGTGFSSISHLQNFPLNTVKIDKTLMPASQDNAKALSLIYGLSTMIHSLGLEIVGEGVESSSHATLCEKLEIQKAQGYFFGKPYTEEEVEETYFKK
ncbi:two-component system response regulator [Paremcibacter congregatus]|uniref:two-component system response regulator n=1 Tax=Paremcibacter congregatus TaxID=2043170 RepID=UPI0030EC5880|tara:strand:- start:1682 stop:3379 length:1698 start_codon:yes stop_codon:yes gene_type:complete